MTYRFTVVVVLALGSFVLGGCRSAEPKQLPEYVLELSQLPYPGDADHGPDLDIVVVRRGNAVELANLSAYRYHDLQLWLNHEYVGLVETIEIGRPAAGNIIALGQFVNLHRETFPLGSILMPDKGAKLRLAELYDPATGLRHRVRVQQ